MCCTRLSENTGRKNYAKNCHLRSIAQICQAISSQLRHVFDSWNNIVKWHYLLHLSLQYGELRPTNGWDPLASLGHPSKFQRVSRHAFVTAATSTKLCTMLGRFLHWYTVGLLPPNGILPAAKFTLSSSLTFSYTGSVTARHSSSGRQLNFVAWY